MVWSCAEEHRRHWQYALDVEDLADEVLVYLVDDRGLLQVHFTPEDCPETVLLSFLRRVVGRLARRLDRLARAGAQPIPLDERYALPAHKPAEFMFADTEKQPHFRLDEILCGLRKQEEELIRLKVCQDLSNEEICARLGLTGRALRARWFRLKNKLARLLEDVFPPETKKS